MTHCSARRTHRRLAGIAAALVTLALAPVAVLAHASLVTSVPANGTTLTAPPVAITATYAEAFDPTRSSMQLLGPDGATLATNVPATSATAESMTISGFGPLATGTYNVQWTTITPDDNGIERGTFSFTVAAPASGAASSAAPGAVATAVASPAAGGGTTSGGVGETMLPLVALVALVIAGLAWFLRRSR